MIKNEVLALVQINPHTHVGQLSFMQLQHIVLQTRQYSWQFYSWKKGFVLRDNLRIHRKSVCPVCGGKLIQEKIGKRMRWSYYCPICQK